MKENIKYSVIIPVYNAQRTLERCLNSLVEQNRDDVEIIAINDGSVDNSAEIVAMFAEKNNNIVAINQKNSGVSRTRNHGLDIANGTYITFVDSDDYVSQDYFEVLDSMDDSDLGVFDSQDIGSDTDSAELFTKLEQMDTMEEKLELLLASRKIMPPWNKRYKNEIIQKNSLRFVEDFKIGEDFDYCMSYALQCNSICIKNSILYYVDISDKASLSRKYRPHLDKQMTAVFQDIEQTFYNVIENKFNKERFLSLLDYLYIKNTFSCIAEEFKTGKPRYWKEHKKYISICNTFRYVVGGNCCYYNWMHRCLRILVRTRVIFPIYAVTYMIKWRRFQKYTEG